MMIDKIHCLRFHFLILFYIFIFLDQMMQYVRSLEQRVKTLEEEKRLLCQKLCSAGINLEVDRPSGWDLVDPVSYAQVCFPISFNLYCFR